MRKKFLLVISLLCGLTIAYGVLAVGLPTITVDSGAPLNLTLDSGIFSGSPFTFTVSSPLVNRCVDVPSTVVIGGKNLVAGVNYGINPAGYSSWSGDTICGIGTFTITITFINIPSTATPGSYSYTVSSDEFPTTPSVSKTIVVPESRFWGATFNVARQSSSGYAGKYYVDCGAAFVMCNLLPIVNDSSEVWVIDGTSGDYVGSPPGGAGAGYVDSLNWTSVGRISSISPQTALLVGAGNSVSRITVSRIRFDGGFNATSASSVGLYSQHEIPPPDPIPTCSLSASPSTINAGSSSTLSWSSTNTYNCSASWTSSTSTSGTKSVSPSSTTSYNILCWGYGGQCEAPATVTVNPIASSLSITPASSNLSIDYNSGGTQAFSISSSNISGNNIYIYVTKEGVTGSAIMDSIASSNTTVSKILNLSSITTGGTVTVTISATGLDSVPRTASATVNVTVPRPTGTISSTGCTIPSGGSSCTAKITWSTANLISGAQTAVTKDRPNPDTVFSNATSGTNVIDTIGYGETEYYLYHNGNQLAGPAPAVALCASGTEWDVTNNKCSPPVCGSSNSGNFYTAPTTNLCSVGTASSVTGTGPWNWSCAGSNGGSASCSANKITDPICAAAHYGCAAGTSSNNVNGATSWTWTCNGVNTTKTVSCSETKDSIQGNISATGCSISLNSSTCSAKATWSTSGLPASSTTEVTRNNPDGTHVSWLTSGTNVTNAVTYGQTTFFLYNSEKATPLASSSINVGCASGSWNGSTCAATPVNGGWSAWTPASCPTACGQPASTLTRTCTNPSPANGGTDCVGSATQSCAATEACVDNRPDLTASVPSPTSVSLNVAQTFSSTVTNSGNTSTGSGFTNLFQTATGANGTGTITDYAVSGMSALASGATSTFSKSLTFTSPGVLYIRACADKSSAANTGTITESNDNNNCSAWVELTVNAPLTPTATLTATPSSITKGASSVLAWSSTNASSCSAMGFATGGATSGSVTVAPTVTSTYNLICYGSESNATDQATVTVTVVGNNKKPIYKEE